MFYTDFIKVVGLQISRISCFVIDSKGTNLIVRDFLLSKGRLFLEIFSLLIKIFSRILHINVVVKRLDGIVRRGLNGFSYAQSISGHYLTT